MGKTPTIYDVSELAGVSTATISRVLNNPEKVKPCTKEKVMMAIQELGYRPLLEARLRTAHDFERICVCAPRFTENSFVERLRGITVALAGQDYELQVYSVASKLQMDRFIDSLELRGLNGLITLSIPFTDEQIKRIKECGIEMVMIEYSSPLTNCVVIDDRMGGKLAAQHLIEKGRKKFGFAAELNKSDYSVYPISGRLEGYHSTLKSHGFELNPRYIYDVKCDTDQTYLNFLKIFRSGEFPDAIFAAADVQALGILRAAKEVGLNIPQDVAVIGFDDIDFADYVGLTTIRQNLDHSGKVAVDLLINRLKDPERLIQLVQLPVELVVRKTT